MSIQVLFIPYSLRAAAGGEAIPENQASNETRRHYCSSQINENVEVFQL